MSEYKDSKKKMDDYMDHLDHHGSAKIKRKSALATKDFGTKVPDKLEQLKDQNQSLKKHQQDLNTEVKVISTQLRRMIEQLKSDKVLPGKAAQFEKELDSLIEEQVKLKEDELSLMKKVKTNQKKAELVESGIENSYNQKTIEPIFQSSISKSGSRSASRGEPRSANGLTIQQESQLKIMKEQLFNQSKNIQMLRHQVEEYRNQKQSSANSSMLYDEKRKLEIKLIDARSELTTVEADYHTKKSIFSRNKDFHNSLLDQYKNLAEKKLNLEKSQRETMSAGSQVDYLRQQIQEAKDERDQLSREFENLMRQPFFKKENEKNNHQKMTQIQSEISKIELDIKKSKINFTKLSNDQKDLADSRKQLESEKKHFEDDIRKFTTYNDPGGISLEQIRAKLMEQDPSLFRQTVYDMQYTGDEPQWQKYDQKSRLNELENTENIPKDQMLKKEKKRLENERHELAAELQRNQDLLKQQVDIDKHNNEQDMNDIRLLSMKIKKNAEIIHQYENLSQSRNAQINELKKELPASQKVLTAENLKKLGLTQNMTNIDEDAMTEFSIATAESELLPQQNILDLRVSNVEFEKSTLCSMLGMKDALPQSIQTFMTIDFFNHDTKNTNVAQGYEPQFDTVFSFKNNVDDFYLNYLGKESVLAEFFAIKGGSEKKSEKIGEAKLPLSRLLQGDNSFQAQEIRCSSGHLGKIFYRTRMRQSLNEALKWMQEKSKVASKQSFSDQTSKTVINTALLKKIFEVTIGRCSGLKRNDPSFNPRTMKPFFTFDFYRFEYRSAIAEGDSPTFDVTRRYEVEESQELRDYFKFQFLKIDFIDDAVEYDNAGGMTDYIGSIRIPLNTFLEKDKIESFFEVKNEKSQTMGQVQIKIQYADSYYIQSQDNKNQEALQSEIIEQQVILKIAEKFAKQGFEDIQLVLDTLFMKALPERPFQVTQEQFREYVLKDLKVTVTDRDLELFFKTNPVLQKAGGLIDKGDVLKIFEYPFKSALDKEQERTGIITQQRVMNMPTQGSFGGEMPFFEADRKVSFAQGGKTLGQTYLNDTLNNRDLGGMTMNR